MHEEEGKVIVKHKKVKIWSYAPTGCPTPKRTSRLTVGRKLNFRT
jgi:hypothetical protein